tara:strand:- start:329 stop:499 length:171 start_codon:yes stop_codon:yes gene_type:complete
MKITKYAILKDGKEIFSDMTQNECFDRMEDFAVEFYQTGNNDPSKFTIKMTEENNG